MRRAPTASVFRLPRGPVGPVDAPTVGADVALWDTKQAARYLGMSPSWLEANPHITWIDMSLPGAKRPTRRYRKADLDEYIRTRVRTPLTSRQA